ncbi:ribose 5-phosphate isomerase B [Kordiimonas sediminis]|uniref:Ribose 5-phosphate isomerase B n=1 Tax=Kordiimonas sediminis TaxID=1735581 RepID=A0A919E8P6_9PROT|nr:ribose 5-phosphate isomerase B [Kordiimonas sediminis]GHF29156.1 ribose 5-phosphate isomerase B [Kordiimonas sediminis]
MSHSKIIALASDHAGYQLKSYLKSYVEEQGYETLDLGTNGSESVDYPDFGQAMGVAIADKQADFGILVCGSGIGISISANRNPAVRAALCHDGLSARLSRQHNDANVLALGERLIGIETAKDCVDAFLSTEFEGGRHQRRIDKMS